MDTLILLNENKNVEAIIETLSSMAAQTKQGLWHEKTVEKEVSRKSSLLFLEARKEGLCHTARDVSEGCGEGCLEEKSFTFYLSGAKTHLIIIDKPTTNSNILLSFLHVESLSKRLFFFFSKLFF